MKPTEQAKAYVKLKNDQCNGLLSDGDKLAIQFAYMAGFNEAISQMRSELAAVHTALEDRIKQLREADSKFCYDRWENKEISQLERNLAREMSNSVTLARQELESILQLFKSPQPPTDKL